MEQLYNDILDGVTTEAQAEEALKKKKNMGIFSNGVGFLIDLSSATKIFSFSYDVFAGTSKEDGKTLYPKEDRNYCWYIVKTTIGAGVNFMMSKNIFTGVISVFSDFTGMLTKNHTITIDYYRKENNNESINNPVVERKYVILNASNDFNYVLEGIWSSFNSDMNSLDRVIFTRDNTPVEFIYHKNYKSSFKNTFEFRAGTQEYKMVSILKRLYFPTDNNPIHIAKTTKGNAIRLLANYYANYGEGASRVLNDLKNITDELKQLAAAHCLNELKGYALENETLNTGRYSQDKLNQYSKKHLETRANFLRTILYERAKNRALATVYYEDTGNGEHSNRTFDENGNLKDFGSSIAYNQNIFVDGSFNSLNIKSAKYNIFGYSKGDNITISKNAGDVYAELGLGSDTITTGSGNDTIYTNANINDEFDNEASSTVNTVNSGAGDDTIYGSKGKDIITTKKGTNHIYTKSGDDEVNVEDGKNYIYLGSGSDKVNTNNGTNYIYTGINNTNENDQDTKDDINTIYLGIDSDIVNTNSGNNIVYA